MANRKHQWNPFSISFEGLDLGLTMDEILADLEPGLLTSWSEPVARIEESAA